MQLIGMLDSPYVRRVAVSLQLLGLPFRHRSLSVFSTFDEFRRVSPVVKAPSLVCDDGTVLLDSTLILQYAEALARPRRLTPAEPHALRHDLAVTGLALAACEKSVQIVYEHRVRPPEKLHQPWVDRVTDQMLTALELLEAEVARRPLPAASGALTQAAVTTGVVWHFIHAMLPQALPAGRFPALRAFSAQAEALPAFMAAPHGESTCRAGER